MDNAMNQKYKDIKLNPPLIEMFTDLIGKDEVTRSIFIYIGRRLAVIASDLNSESKIGATINSITSDLIVKRRVKKTIRGKVVFEPIETNLERKHVERVVNSLLLTGLCYFEQVGKTKVIYPTERGLDVLKALRIKEKNIQNY